MMSALRRFGRLRAAPLTALAVLLLAVRLLAPTAAPSPGPGYIPICSGAGVVYVYVGEGAPEADPSAHVSDPCAWFGLHHAAPAPTAPALPAPPRASEAGSIVPALQAAPAPAVGFRPRAPPVLA
jgi:hypothetical protein